MNSHTPDRLPDGSQDTPRAIHLNYYTLTFEIEHEPSMGLLDYNMHSQRHLLDEPSSHEMIGRFYHKVIYQSFNIKKRGQWSHPFWK